MVKKPLKLIWPRVLSIQLKQLNCFKFNLKKPKIIFLFYVNGIDKIQKFNLIKPLPSFKYLAITTHFVGEKHSKFSKN